MSETTQIGWNAEQRDHVGLMLFTTEHGLATDAARVAWEALTEDERETWRVGGIDKVHAYQAHSPAERKRQDRANTKRLLDANEARYQELRSAPAVPERGEEETEEKRRLRLMQAIRDLAALVEDRVRRGGEPDYHEQSAWKWIEVYVNELTRARPEGEDARRMDALQRWAEEHVNVGDTEDIVSLEVFDDEEEPGCEWTVIGPNEAPGVRRLGQGATLRDAIDDALNDERELAAARHSGSGPSTPTRSERDA